VVVSGLLRETQASSGQGARRPDGRLRLVSRPDLDLLARQAGGPAHPLWLQRTDQNPRDAGALPLPPELPQVGDPGPHRAYAVQWFLFAAVGLVGYPLLLRHVARDRSAGTAHLR
jgi:surfeit locus 1 family protein